MRDDSLRPIYAYGLVVVWVLLNWGWTCSFGLVNDDYRWIGEAQRTWAGVTEVPGRTFLRPIVEMSFLASYTLAGARPFAYHATNLLLELTNSLLVLHLARVIFASAATATLVAVLFTAHPSHSGAVSWVCGRTELIGVGFYLAALHADLRRRTLLAAILFALALLSKENMVTFPFVALLLDYVRADRSGWFKRMLIYGSILGTYLVVRQNSAILFTLDSAGAGLVARGEWGALFDRVRQQGGAAAHAILEPLRLGTGLTLWISACLGALAYWLAPNGGLRRVVLAALAWIIVTIAPFLGWVMFHPRYVYLASIGWALLAAALATWLWRLSPQTWVRLLVGAFAVAWLIGSSWFLQLRNEQWRRNGVQSARIVDALAILVPEPAANTVFVVDGLGPMRIGRDPWARTPVFVFGFDDAIRLHFDDPTLDVRFPGESLPSDRPIVRMRWQGNEFVRQSGS